MFFLFFFFNDTATTEIYTLSLHDALPIWLQPRPSSDVASCATSMSGRCSLCLTSSVPPIMKVASTRRSEEHTSELQSLAYLVCRLLLEKKKKLRIRQPTDTKHRT